MSEIKNKLYKAIENIMIPEVEAYLEDLYKIIEQNKQNEENLEEIRDLESFLVELQNILLAINENKMDNSQAEEIYQKIEKLMEESN